MYTKTLTDAGLVFGKNGPDTQKELSDFLRKAYLWVPYHNICHAVMTMLHTESFVKGATKKEFKPN